MYNYNYTILLMLLVSVPCFSQIQCPSALNEPATIANQYRQNTIQSHGTTNNVRGGADFYKVDSNGTQLELGFLRYALAGALDIEGNLSVATTDALAYLSGPVISDEERTSEFCDFYNRAWIIKRDEILNHRALFENGQLDLNSIPKNIIEWPAIGNPHIGSFVPDYEMAPFYDKDNNGAYEPLQGDYPIALVEDPNFIPYEFRFNVYNDGGKGNSFFNRIPMGLEFHQLQFVVDCSWESESEHSVFSRLKYINRSTEDKLNFRLGVYDDSHIGCDENDFVGCNLALNCTYTYDKDGNDKDGCGQGSDLPEDAGTVRTVVYLNKEMKSFIYCNRENSTSPVTVCPTNPEEYYKSLNGLWLNGSPIIEGGDGSGIGQGDTTLFAMPDRPDLVGGWSMQQEDFAATHVATITSFDNKTLASEAVGTLDFVDHILYDVEHTGLDIFSVWESSVTELKSDYQAMINGSFNCGKGLGVDVQEAENQSFRLYPNPATLELKVEFPVFKSGEIAIYSSSGLLIGSYRLDNQADMTVDVSAYEAGFYFISYDDEQGGYSSSYFIKT